MVKNLPFRMYDLRPRGAIVNVAFTIDTYSLDLLHKAGKNRSRTVRMALWHWLGSSEETMSCAELYESHQAILEKFRVKCIQVDRMKKIINSQLPDVDLEAEFKDL